MADISAWQSLPNPRKADISALPPLSYPRKAYIAALLTYLLFRLVSYDDLHFTLREVLCGARLIVNRQT